jgi:predicted RNA binding protein YcfA (HicA-like mRNA interferase family)
MSVADKLHQRQMALRKKSGLPHPDYYKELGHSYGISDDKERLAKQAEIKKKYKVEEVEQLDEMPESSMKTRDVHAHLRKSGWTLKRTGGGHDVYAHPKSKEHIAVPRHKQLKAPLIRGIMKASRVSEETEIDEQLEKKGRFVSGPVKKPFKSSTIVSPIKEAKDPREYDYEGDMAMSQLRSLVFNAEDLIEMMDENTNLPEWVQSKITLAEDYISTAANYLRGELTEAANPAQQAAIAINMKKKGIKPKNEEVEHLDEISSDTAKSYLDKVRFKQAKRAVKANIGAPREKPLAAAALDRTAKSMELARKRVKEEVELQEGRPSQRHPLEGHDYHKKSNEALVHIAKDAHEAAEAMKSHNTTAENKYRDQANDSATVRHWRKKNGMPDWYKKKYGHVNEEFELDEGMEGGTYVRRDLSGRPIAPKSTLSFRKYAVKSDGTQGKELKVGTLTPYTDKEKRERDSEEVRSGHISADKYKEHMKKYGHLYKKEEFEYLEEKNEPTNPALWSKAKSLARSKFDVYPSAYANGWAAKWYKSKGGGWKTVSEDVDDPSAAARTLSRKAQIVKDAAKGKKQEQEQASDKFQKDPELSSDIQKT